VTATRNEGPLAPGTSELFRWAADRSRSEANRRWRDKAAWFAGKGDGGKAETALIGLAGVLREAAQ
jgi:hypothetical protein